MDKELSNKKFTQKEKDLVVIDLSSRIPYGVMVYIEFNDGKIFKKRKFAPIMIHDYLKLSLDKVMFKPYLRPLSSMTNEEKEEYQYITERWMHDASYHISDSIDWLNAHHFDYRELIPKGLALLAPEGMYPNL